MGAAYFYHLTRSSVDQTLMLLLPRALQAGWRVELRGTDPALMDRLDHALWSGPPDSFLPHGRAGGAHDAAQPVLLTCGEEAQNGATCVMSVHSAPVSAQEVQDLDRVCILFDGHDGDALAQARQQWKTLKQAGCEAQYWSQENGPWEQKA